MKKREKIKMSRETEKMSSQSAKRFHFLMDTPQHFKDIISCFRVFPLFPFFHPFYLNLELTYPTRIQHNNDNDGHGEIKAIF